MSCDNPDCQDPDCVGLQNAQQTITDSIKAGGWTVIGVGDSPVFTYSIGLHHQHLPELIMVGLDIHLAHQIINHCAEIMLDQGQFSHGSQTDALANMPTTIIDVLMENKKEYAFQAFNHYKHWDFAMQQLVMPDPKGLFFWEQGVSQRLLKAQTILGHPPLEKMN
jgi:hypothetical protein